MKYDANWTFEMEWIIYLRKKKYSDNEIMNFLKVDDADLPILQRLLRNHKLDKTTFGKGLAIARKAQLLAEKKELRLKSGRIPSCSKMRLKEFREGAVAMKGFTEFKLITEVMTIISLSRKNNKKDWEIRKEIGVEKLFSKTITDLMKYHAKDPAKFDLERKTIEEQKALWEKEDAYIKARCVRLLTKPYKKIFKRSYVLAKDGEVVNRPSSRIFYRANWMSDKAATLPQCHCGETMNIMVFISHAEIKKVVPYANIMGNCAIALCSNMDCQIGDDSWKLIQNQDRVNELLRLSKCKLESLKREKDYPGSFHDSTVEILTEYIPNLVGPFSDDIYGIIQERYHEYSTSKIGGLCCLANPTSCNHCQNSNLDAILNLVPVHLGIGSFHDWHWTILGCPACKKIQCHWQGT